MKQGLKQKAKRPQRSNKLQPKYYIKCLSINILSLFHLKISFKAKFTLTIVISVTAVSCRGQRFKIRFTTRIWVMRSS